MYEEMGVVCGSGRFGDGSLVDRGMGVDDGKPGRVVGLTESCFFWIVIV